MPTLRNLPYESFVWLNCAIQFVRHTESRCSWHPKVSKRRQYADGSEHKTRRAVLAVGIPACTGEKGRLHTDYGLIKTALARLLIRVSNIAKAADICNSLQKFVFRNACLSASFKWRTFSQAAKLRRGSFVAKTGRSDAGLIPLEKFFAGCLQFEITLTILLTRISDYLEGHHARSGFCWN